MGSGLFPNVLGSRFVVRGLAPCWDRERRTSPRKRLGDVVSYACPLLGPGAGDKPPHYGFATYASRILCRTALGSSQTPAVGIADDAGYMSCPIVWPLALDHGGFCVCYHLRSV